MPEGGGSHEKGGWEIFEGESYQKKKKKIVKKAKHIFSPNFERILLYWTYA